MVTYCISNCGFLFSVIIKYIKDEREQPTARLIKPMYAEFTPFPP